MSMIDSSLPLFAALGRPARIAIALGVALALIAGFVAVLPFVIQRLLRVLLSVRYRLRVVGLEHVPRTGPVLLTANHLTWYDGFFLAAVLPRRGTALMYAG